MDLLVHIETIRDLYKMLAQGDPKHPQIDIIDFSRIDFSGIDNIKVSSGFYTVMEKNLCPGALRYGRNYYDFQEVTLFFVSPNQLISLENPDETKDVFGWEFVFHPELIRDSTLNGKMKDYSFFSYNVHEAMHLLEKEKQTQ